MGQYAADSGIGTKSAQAKQLAGANNASVVTFMSWVGAFCLFMFFYLIGSWVFSDQFTPVDPGPDPIPNSELYALYFLQIAIVSVAVYFYWRFLIKPKLRGEPLSTDGLILLALPFVWWQDPTFNYSQNWITYNAYLFNMGSWTGDLFPTWLAANGDQFPEAFVLIFAWIVWPFGTALFGCWVLRNTKRRWPQMNTLQMLTVLFLACLVFDFIIEYACVRIGWYAMPGAWQALSLHAGTRYQISMLEIFFGAWMTFGYGVIRYYRDDKGYTMAEKGIDSMKLAPKKHLAVRFLAILALVNLTFFVTYGLPIQFQALHTDPWPTDTPSYLATTCPEYRTQPELCGGPGRGIHRPDHIWLPAKED